MKKDKKTHLKRGNEEIFFRKCKQKIKEKRLYKIQKQENK